MTVIPLRRDNLHDATSTIECPRCGAPAGARCMNPTTGHTARVPCITRIRAAGLPPAQSSIPPAQTQPTESIDSSGDQWVHAYLTIAPQSLARLATNLDATTQTVETALNRLEAIGHAQHHPDGWSLPRNWTTA